MVFQDLDAVEAGGYAVEPFRHRDQRCLLRFGAVAVCPSGRFDGTVPR